MALRIADQVIRAQIDNRVKNRITGAIWLAGLDKQASLDLEGNAWSDMAGCLVTISNPRADPRNLDAFSLVQRGVCGDMTVSRKVKIPTVDVKQWLKEHPHEPFPCRWGNAVYLEWFSEANGRVVIEAADFQITITEPSWRLTPEEEQQQHELNARAMTAFVARAQETFEPDSEPGDPESDDHAPFVKRRELLARHGINPLPPDSLSEEQLTKELWSVIRALARHRIYLYNTDHLSDRALYKLLVEEIFEEETKILPPSSPFNCDILVDVYGIPGDPKGNQIYLRYYASEQERDRWSNDFPDEPLPPHEDPPYDRDAYMPAPEEDD